MKYPVIETFTSFQGEGVHMGRRAYFIRLAGCDVGCSWCDTPETWREMGPITMMTPVELADEVPQDCFVVVTGGEPTLHDLVPLVDTLIDRGVRAHLETAGHRPIVRGFAWVALSPKPRKPPIASSVVLADEIKIVVNEYFDIIVGLAETSARRPGVPVWLQPEWSRRAEVADIIARSVGGDIRAGVQLHKHMRVR